MNLPNTSQFSPAMYAKARGLTIGRPGGVGGGKRSERTENRQHKMEWPTLLSSVSRVKSASWRVWLVALVLYCSLAFVLQPDEEEIFQEKILDLKDWVTEVSHDGFLMCVCYIIPYYIILLL